MRSFLSIDSLFYKTSAKVVQLLILNFLFLLGCVPLVTIGASLSATFSACMKMIESDDLRVTTNYFKAFRQSFKQATVVWIGSLFVLGILWIDILYLVQKKALLSWPMIGIGIVGFLLLVILQYSFALIARYQNSLGKVIPLAFQLFFAHPFLGILLLTVWFVPVVLSILSPILLVFSMYLACFISFSFEFFLQSYVLLSVLKKFE